MARIKLLPITTSLILSVPAEAPLWPRRQAKRGRQNHAKQILVSGQRSAEEGTQPSGYERLRLKKSQNYYDRLRNICREDGKALIVHCNHQRNRLSICLRFSLRISGELALKIIARKVQAIMQYRFF